MPYIKPERRLPLERDINSIVERLEHGEYEPGDLNYVITRLCQGFLGEQANYAAYNEVVGVLECAKLELYREVIAPYEDVKMYENGGVWREP